jgi:cytochrome c oxidase cbb3-type subunit 3
MNRLSCGLLLGLVLCGSGYSSPLPRQEPDQSPPRGATNPPPKGFDVQQAIRDFMATGKAPDPEAVKRGQAIFIPTCGFCHGSTGRGGSGGPSLVRSLVVLHDQGTGKEIFPVVHEGRIAKGMPAFPLAEKQVQDIAAYLFSLVQATANRHEYKTLNLVTGDAAQGETYFKAHCASCHSPSGDLAHIASKYPPEFLESRFLYPKMQRYPGTPPPDPRELSTATVKLESGQTYSGTVDKIDDFSISITDASGAKHSWEFDAEPGIKVEVTYPLEAHRELLHQYSDADMHNILTYLETLK